MKYYIGIAGIQRSGKSTLGRFLENRLLKMDQKVLYLPFAKKVKEIAYSMGWDGVKDVKGRRLLQLIGTECGRECIDENIWIKYWEQEINDSLAQYIIADDLRFENELKTISNNNGLLIKINGRGMSNINNHPSEIGLADSKFDVIYINDKTIGAIRIFSDKLIWEILNQKVVNNEK